MPTAQDNNPAATASANAAYLSANPTAFGAVPTKAPAAPTATPPVSIIGTNGAASTLQNTMIPAMQTASQNIVAQNAKLAYNAGQGGSFADGSGFDGKGNSLPTNSQTPNSGTSGANNGSTTPPSTTSPELTPGTPEHTLLNTPEAGYQYAYDPQGNRLEVPIGNIPVGLTTTPPPAPPTVSGQATQTNGTTIKQLSDGTYGSYDINGNFQGQATPQQFQDAQTANTLSQNIANLANGTMPLSAAEQAQVNSLKAAFQQLIVQQETANKNFTGGTTIAENLYGMGNTLVGLGEIKGTIDAGIAKIADLNSQMAGAVAKMEQGFKEDDMQMFKSAYDVLVGAQKDRQTAIDTAKAAMDAKVKDARDYNLRVLTQQQEQKHQEFQDKISADNLSLAQKKQVFDEYIQQADLTEKQKMNANEIWYKQQDIALRRQASSPTAPGNMPAVQLSPAGTPLAASQKAFLAALPTDVATMVKGLANYTINPTDFATALRKGAPGMTRADAVSLAKQYDPTYDDSQWQSRQKLQNDFTSGKYSQNVTSLNTAATHIADLAVNFSNLGNHGGLLTPLNSTINGLSNLFGASQVTKAQNNITAAKDEMATAFKGSGATDQQIKSWEHGFNVNMSPAQSQAFIESSLQLLGDRLQNLSETYEQGMGKPAENGFLHDSVAANLISLKNAGYNVNVPALDQTPAVKLSNAAKDPKVASTISQIRQIAPNITPEEMLAQLGLQ